MKNKPRARPSSSPPPSENAKASGVRKAHKRDLREANEQLVREAVRATEAEEDLRSGAEFRERLIGVLGHDLRNPLNAIMMAAGLLATNDRLSPEDHDLAHRILESGRRMRRMIAHVLEFTRARLGGGFELDLAEVDLARTCEQIATELRLGASADIEIHVHGDPTGTWDGDRLAEAISNIAGNAVEHAIPGTPVLVEVLGDDDDVCVAVTNEGQPIPSEMLPLIFDPFRRGNAGPREPGHLGLGLYIACEVVRAHGGSLDAHCGGGRTTFTMRLPRAAHNT